MEVRAKGYESFPLEHIRGKGIHSSWEDAKREIIDHNIFEPDLEGENSALGRKGANII